jgi:PAS domain S-box-containing protein
MQDEQRSAERAQQRDKMWRLSRDLFVVIDRRWKILAVNPAAGQLLGYSEEEAIGRRFDKFMHPDDFSLAARSIRAAASGPVGDFEARLRAKDGMWRWFSWSAAPGVGEAFVIGRDVTADRERRRELELAKEQLLHAQKMDSLGQLTGGVAHDFNNLLTAVLGGLDLILTFAEDDRIAHLAQAAMEAAQRGTKLTSQLLTFSRMQRLELRSVKAAQIIEGMRNLLSRTLGPTIRLKIEVDDREAVVMADAIQLELAILNLAINGRDAMPDGGELTISVLQQSVSNETELPDGDYVEIQVVDTGSGMAPEIAARAFDPFFTTKGVGKGTGLGLSMVYGVAKQSGGGVRIRSRKGMTSVSMLLPRSFQPAILEAPDTEHPGRIRTGKGARLLLIDDDEDVRGSVADMLDALDYEVTAASDGETGLRLFDEAEFDLLIVDFAMPGMSGAEFAESVRRSRAAQPILFITGYAESAALERSASDASVLRKPFRIGELARAVETSLALGQAACRHANGDRDEAGRRDGSGFPAS